MCSDNEKSGGFIQGDKFAGLSIAGRTNEIYQFELDGQTAIVRQTWQQITASQAVLDLAFNLSEPLRFRVDVLIPSDCKNACATLNNQLLIGWFAKDAPDGFPEILLSSCQDQGEKESTLHPGQFQSINFRWFNQDKLRFYLIW